MNVSTGKAAVLARKATACLASAALACALVPAAAIPAAAADDDAADTTDATETYSLSARDQSKEIDLGIADVTFDYDSDDDGEADSTDIIWEDGSWTSYDIDSSGTGTAVWSTYVKGDDSHYGHYDAQFTFTVEDGVLTGVDMSSQGTTFGGVWGNISKSTTIMGYLPTGVSNTTSVTTADDGSATISIGLSYTDPDDESATADDTVASLGGWSVSSATIYEVASDGGLYELDENGDVVYEEVYDESDGDTDSVAVSLGSTTLDLSADATVTDDDGNTIYTYDSSENAVTVADVSTKSGYGLLEVTYQIGSYYKFTQYTALNDYGDLYDFDDTDFWAEPDGIGQKNREQYTASAYNTIIERELPSFVEYLADEDADEESGYAEVDVVSGATKSSDAVIEAVYAALGYYYPITNQGDYVTLDPTDASTLDDGWSAIFSSVSDDLTVTMDANPGENYEPAEGTIDANDHTCVTTDSSGNTVITSDLFSGNSDMMLLSSVALYDYDDSTLTDAQFVNLGLETGYAVVGTSTDDYEGKDEYLGGTVTSTTVNHGFLGELDSCTIYASSDDTAAIATYDSDSRSLTILSSDVTHVAFGFAVSKKSSYSERSGITGFAYDVGAMEDSLDANLSALEAGASAFSSETYNQGKQADFGIADEEFSYDSDGDGEVDSSDIIWEDGSWSSYNIDSDGTGTAVWSTYVKGDNSHYGHYDAQFTFTVEKGVLTGVDMSSQGTTFGGVWGNISKSTTITGYLPTGVTNTTSTSATSESATVSIGLSYTDPDDEDATADDTIASLGGWSVSSATLYEVASDGGLYELDSEGNIVYEEVYDESDGDTDSVAVSLGSLDVTDEASEGAVSIGDISTESGYGLLEVTYQIGSYYKFTQYTALNAYGAKYEVTDTDFYAEPDGIGQKNREQYTASAYNTIIERELASFVEGLSDESATEESGYAEVDVVSGATKSSDAVIEAVYAALGYYYPITNQGDYVTVSPTDASTLDDGWSAIFSSVSDDLTVTMDANPGENYTPEEGTIDANDKTRVTTDSSGNTVVTAGLLSSVSDMMLLSSVALYKYDSTLTDQQFVNLGLETGYAVVGTSTDDYEGKDEYLGGTVTSTTVNHGFLGELDSCTIYASDGTTELATYDSTTRSLTILSSDVTHVAFGYAVSKKSSYSERAGITGFAYDLSALAAAAASADSSEASGSATGDSGSQTAASSLKNPAKITAKTISVKGKYKKNKLVKAIKVAASKGVKVKNNKGGKVTIAPAKLTVKKGTRKGKTLSYKVKVKIAKKGSYKALSKTVTVKVKLK